MSRKAKGMEVVSVRGREVRPLPGWCLVCRITGILLLLLQIALLLGNGMGWKLLLGGINQRLAYFLLDAVILVCGVFSLSWRRRWIHFFTGAAALFCILLYGTNVASYGKDLRYFEYHSPAGTNTLVAEENAFLFRGDIRFYRRENDLFLRDTGAFLHFDDGYQSLESGSFSLVWADENRAEVEFSGAENSTTQRKLTVYLNGE